MHDTLTIGIPTFVIFLGILLGRRDVSDLRAQMNRGFDEMSREMSRRFDEISREMSRRFEGVDKRLDRIDDDLKHFHNVTGNLEGRIEQISRR